MFVVDHHPWNGVRSNHRLLQMLRPQQNAMRNAKVMSAMEGFGHFHRRANHEDGYDPNAHFLEHFDPQWSEPAQAWILKSPQRHAVEIALYDHADFIARRICGCTRLPSIGERTEVVPIQLKRFQQLVIDADDVSMLPETLGIHLCRAEQVRPEIHAHKVETAGQRRRATAVHTQHQYAGWPSR